MGKHQRHHATGMRRTQLYLSQETRDALDIENPLLHKNEQGRSVSKLSDRMGQMLSIYTSVVTEFMPTLSADRWRAAFDRLRQSESYFAEARLIASELPSEHAVLAAMGIAESFRRFETFSPDLPERDRLIGAGCKLDTQQ